MNEVIIGYNYARVCEVASKNITFKKSTKSFER
jgi:hypothetical protein